MKFILFNLFFFLFCIGCQKDTDASVDESPSSAAQSKPTIALSEHERIIDLGKSRIGDLQAKLNFIVSESEDKEARSKEVIDQLRAEIIALNETLNEYRSLALESKNSLREIKKIGSKEYRDVYELAKGVSHEKAILMYEEFLKKFPDSSISSKARSRIKFHAGETKILENRRNARTLRVWETKLKGEGLFARRVSEESLFNLIGRKPDSSRRGSSSEHKERIYVWRDYILDGGYHDMFVETTDGIVDRVYKSE